MKVKQVLLGVLLIACMGVSVVWADGVLFRANYDATLDAQVVPPGGSVSAAVTDADGDAGLSTGGQGVGGSGEGLRVRDLADDVEYRLDTTWPNTSWFPETGRITLWFKIVSGGAFSAGNHLALWDFTYNAGTFSQAYMQLGIIHPTAGDQKIWFRSRLFNSTSWQYTGASLPGLPLSTSGWHEVVFEWEMNGPKPALNSTASVAAQVRCWVDGELSLNEAAAQLGSVCTFNEIHVGNVYNGQAGLLPVSYFSADNLYDNAAIEKLPTYCGDEGTVYLPGDISGPGGGPDCVVNLYDFAVLAGEWLDCTEPLNPACDTPLCYSDIVLFGGEETVAVLPYRYWNFVVPAGVKSAYLSLEARYDQASPRGFPEFGVRYWINNSIVGAKYIANVADGRNLATVTGYNLSWDNGGGTYRLPISDDWNSLSNVWLPVELQNDPYRIVIDISKFVVSGKANELWIQNLTGGPDVVCRGARVICEYDKVEPDEQYYDVPAVPAGPVVPRTDFSVDYARAMASGGGMTVTVNGVSYDIESRFSYPNGTWNVLTSGSGAQGEWAGNVTAGGNQVTAIGQQYRLDRVVNNLADRIEVLDTITNLTGNDLGIRLKHYVKVSKSALSKAYLSGLRLPTKEYSAANYVDHRNNSSIYVQKDTTGIGLLARDNVFRAHVSMEMVDGSYGIGDSYFALAPSDSYTMKWEIYPTETADYYAFVNAARRHLQANYLIDGNVVIAFRHVGDPNSFTDQEIVDFIDLNNAKYVIWPVTARLDSAGNVIANDYIMGSDFNKSRGVWNRYWTQEWVNKYHGVNPNLVVLPYTNPWLTTEPGSVTTYADSYVKNPDGSPHIAAGIPGGTEPAMFPTATNTYGPALKGAIDWMLTNADGFYMDGSSEGPWNYRTDIWDNHSAEINGTTFTITRKMTDSSLYTLAYRMARLQDADAQGKSVWMNYGHVTEEEAAFQSYRFVETNFANNPAIAHLGCPTSLPIHTVAYDDLYPLWIKLRQGGLGVISVWPDQVPHEQNILQDIYPIHPVELHCGYVMGQNKIVTSVSGEYGFGDASSLTVRVYDAGGRYLPQRTVSGTGTVTVSLAAGEMAIIVK